MTKILGRVAVGTVAAVASTLLMTGTASANEQVCNTYFCNLTYGSDNHVSRVSAGRNAPIHGVLGYFEAYGRGWTWTGPTSYRYSDDLYINRNVQDGELVCLRFFEYVNGRYYERGAAACTKEPF